MWTIFLMPLLLLAFLLWSGTDKKQALSLAGAVLAVGLACVLLLPGMLGGGTSAQARNLVQTFALNVDAASLRTERLADTHSGFHGDGESLYRFTLTEETPALEDWESLPLPEEVLDRAAVLSEDGERNLLRENLDLDSLRGRWKLVNGAVDGASSEEVWRNWSLCLWDGEQKCLYWYQFDS